MAVGDLITCQTELPFLVYYCERLPLDEIRSNSNHTPDRVDYRLALAKNIEEHGLCNPLIVLNHPMPKCDHRMWLMVGTNRLWALRHLEWTHAPAIVTGSCPFPSVLIAPSDIPDLFKDGKPYHSPYGIALQNTCKPEDYIYPTVTVKHG